jgi:hypothetical protein
MGKKAMFNYHSAQIFSEKSSAFYKGQNMPVLQVGIEKVAAAHRFYW